MILTTSHRKYCSGLSSSSDVHHLCHSSKAARSRAFDIECGFYFPCIVISRTQHFEKARYPQLILEQVTKPAFRLLVIVTTYVPALLDAGTICFNNIDLLRPWHPLIASRSFFSAHQERNTEKKPETRLLLRMIIP